MKRLPPRRQVLSGDDGWGERMAVNEARRWLAERLPFGEHCPVCGQMAKLYRRKVTSGAVRALIDLSVYGDFVHVPSVRGLARLGGEVARMSYWGLVEESDERREDGGHSGYWRITATGLDWLRGRVRIPKYAIIYDGRCMGLRGELISAQDALSHRFDLTELMEAVGW